VVRVWDRPVRALHWALAASVAAAWATTVWFGRWHEAAGYLSIGLVGIRAVWGFVGSRRARFAHFVRGPSATWRYFRRVVGANEPRYLGHNPLGACMVLTFFACLVALALTGWLYTTDALWGDATVERIHFALACAMVVLAVLHVCGVVLASIRHRENLVVAMATGAKREAAGDDID
jgi:cytochrome b